MVDLTRKYENILQEHELFATKTTGTRIIEGTNLQINLLLSGPLGGDQEVGGKVARGELDLVIYLLDPTMVHAHQSDITALIRICNVYNVPLATNKNTSEILINNMSNIYEYV